MTFLLLQNRTAKKMDSADANECDLSQRQFYQATAKLQSDRETQSSRSEQKARNQVPNTSVEIQHEQDFWHNEHSKCDPGSERNQHQDGDGKSEQVSNQNQQPGEDVPSQDQNYSGESEQESDYEQRSKEDEPSLGNQIDLVTQEEEEPDHDGEECELHIYESRRDTRGERVNLRAGTKSKLKSDERRSRQACLVLTRSYRGTELLSTDLEIQSRYIIKALKETIGTYPGLDLRGRYVTVAEPPKCLFHYRDELRRYAENSNNEKMKAHLDLLSQYVQKALHREIKSTSHSYRINPRLWA